MKPKKKKWIIMVALMIGPAAIWHFLFWPPRSSIYAPDDWERLAAQGVQAQNNRDLDQAEDLYNRALETLRNSPPDDIRRATVLLDLGEVEGLRHHFPNADELLQQSIRVFDANPHHFSPQKVIALEELAIAEIAERQNNQSVNHFEQAIALQEKIEGPNSAKLAKILREYAGLLMVLGRVNDSLKAVHRANDIDNNKGQNWPFATIPSTEG